jgi:hypothetical protein
MEAYDIENYLAELGIELQERPRGLCYTTSTDKREDTSTSAEIVR